MKYRTLTAEDRIQLGDLFETWRDEDAHFLSGRHKEYLGMPGKHCGKWRRPIKEHNWIAFKDRKPTKEDCSPDGAILVLYVKGYNQSSSVTYRKTFGVDIYDSATHWMALNFVEEITPIKVDGHEITPMKDGSAKIDCGTTIPKADLDEFFKQRTEVMRDDS